MQKEDLLKMLRDAGLADDAIKALLEECLKDLNPEPAPAPNPEADEEAEKKEAEKLLGVSL